MKSFAEIQAVFKQNQSLIRHTLDQNKIQVNDIPQKLLSFMILIHTINTSQGLKCVNQNDEECLFDIELFRSNQGVFKTRYKIAGKNINSKNQKVQKQYMVLFRFVIYSGQISINFCVQGSEHLHQVKATQLQQFKVVYESYYKQYQLLKKQFKHESDQVQRNNRNDPILRPVPLNYNPYNQDNNYVPPYIPLINPPNQQPINNPFGRDQYVGPNSNIFKNRFNPQNNNPNNLGRVPIGSRYDPVDPFDNMGTYNSSSPNGQFFGFDEFGNPLKNPSINRNNFNGRGGFNGGFGGNSGRFGGFGGNNGSFGNNNFF